MLLFDIFFAVMVLIVKAYIYNHISSHAGRLKDLEGGKCYKPSIQPEREKKRIPEDH